MSTAPNEGTSIVMLLCAVALAAGCGGSSGSPDMTSAAGFAAVETAMANTGCTLATCHGANKDATNMLSLTGTAATDYATIINGTGTHGAYYNKTTPAQSNILIIPTNASGMHGDATTAASAAWTSASPDYQTMLSWLNAGAPQ